MKTPPLSKEYRAKFWIWAVIGSLVVAAGVLAGCNTMEGVGEDMEEAGEEIQEEAND